MQRFVNDLDMIVDDMLKEYVRCHKDTLHISEKDDHIVVKNRQRKHKVGIVSGRGSSHEPCFLGYVSEHVLDAIAIGKVFSSPPAAAFHQAFLEADTGAGVICLFDNYAGDNVDVEMAVQMAAMQQVNIRYVTTNDDIANAPLDEKEKRHGIVGSLFMWKIGCAKTELGDTLGEVIDAVQTAVNETRSLCVGLTPYSIPAVGHANLKIQEGTMEYGIGYHDEPGLIVESLKNAEEIAAVPYERIEADLKLKHGEKISVIVSGLSGTPIIELYALYGEIENYFTERNISVYHSFVDDYVTSLKMSGAALTMMCIKEEFKELLDFPVDTPAITIKQNLKKVAQIGRG